MCKLFFEKEKASPSIIRTWKHAVPPDFVSTPKRRTDTHSTPITAEPVADYTRNKNTPLPRHHSKVTSASFAKGLHQPPSLCAQKACVLLFFIVFQVIVSQKIKIVNILVENICGENFLQEVFPAPLSRTL